METPRYQTRLRTNSLVNMAENNQDKSDDDELDNEEYGCDLDFESLIESVESNDSKVIISILQNQTKIIKDLSFGVKYLKMKVKAVNNRVKSNEEKSAHSKMIIQRKTMR